jgi:hypothetical protein
MLIVFPIGLRATAADVDIVGLQLDGVQIDPKEWWYTACSYCRAYLGDYRLAFMALRK